MTAGARRQFTGEFKDEAVRLVRSSGKTVAQVARELGVSASGLRGWVLSTQAPSGSDLSQSERQELQQLRKENRVLRMERELLKKAAAFFAKEPT